ncbi:MAG: hypothetical protein ACYCV5_02910 [Acidimicrobiales bacterium]
MTRAMALPAPRGGGPSPVAGATGLRPGASRRGRRALGATAVALVSVLGLGATLRATVVTTLSVVPQDGPFVVSTPAGVPGLASRVPVIPPGGSVGAVADVTDLGTGQVGSLALDAIVTPAKGSVSRSGGSPVSSASSPAAAGFAVTVRECSRPWVSSSGGGELVCPGRTTVPGRTRPLHLGTNPILLGGVPTGSTARLEVVVAGVATSGAVGSVHIAWRFDASTVPD